MPLKVNGDGGRGTGKRLRVARQWPGTSPGAARWTTCCSLGPRPAPCRTRRTRRARATLSTTCRTCRALRRPSGRPTGPASLHDLQPQRARGERARERGRDGVESWSLAWSRVGRHAHLCGPKIPTHRFNKIMCVLVVVSYNTSSKHVYYCFITARGIIVDTPGCKIHAAFHPCQQYIAMSIPTRRGGDI